MSKIFKPSKADSKFCSMIVEAEAASLEEKLVLLIDGKQFQLSDQMTQELMRLLKEISKGNQVSIQAVETLMTTQESADYLGYSRPTLIKLLQEYKVPVSKVGKHRRIAFGEILKLRGQIQARQQRAILNLQSLEVELGLLEPER